MDARVVACAAGGCAAVALCMCVQRRRDDIDVADEGIASIPSQPRGAVAGDGPQGVRIIEGGGAYAAVDDHGRMKCWGHPDGGGAQPESTLGDAALLINDIVGTDNGFAAILSDGSLCLWGELSAVREEVLKSFPQNPTKLVSTRRSVLVQNDAGDGVLFGVWGVVEHTKLQAFCLCSTEYADAAILSKTGEVFAVGESYYGAAPPHFTRLTHLCATGSAFAATRDNNTVVSWGDPAGGGEGAPDIAVDSIATTSQAFCALTSSGAIHTWGAVGKGGDSVAARQHLSNKRVASVAATRSAFAALTTCGRVVVWGSEVFGGRQSSADDAIAGKPVKQLFATHFAFAALCEDGSVAAWGDAEFGGSTSAVQALLTTGIHTIVAGPRVFAALKHTVKDGRPSNQVVVWGSHGCGGAMPSEPVTDVSHVVVGTHAVVAVGRSSSLVAWGDKAKGGVISE